MFRVFPAESDGEPAGYALFFDCYAPFQGPNICLEDIFIRPQFRGIGICRALFATVATRLVWIVDSKPLGERFSRVAGDDTVPTFLMHDWEGVACAHRGCV